MPEDESIPAAIVAEGGIEALVGGLRSPSSSVGSQCALALARVAARADGAAAVVRCDAVRPLMELLDVGAGPAENAARALEALAQTRACCRARGGSSGLPWRGSPLLCVARRGVALTHRSLDSRTCSGHRAGGGNPAPRVARKRPPTTVAARGVSGTGSGCGGRSCVRMRAVVTPQ